MVGGLRLARHLAVAVTVLPVVLRLAVQDLLAVVGTVLPVVHRHLAVPLAAVGVHRLAVLLPVMVPLALLPVVPLVILPARLHLVRPTPLRVLLLVVACPPATFLPVCRLAALRVTALRAALPLVGTVLPAVLLVAATAGLLPATDHPAAPVAMAARPVVARPVGVVHRAASFRLPAASRRRRPVHPARGRRRKPWRSAGTR